MKFRIGKYYIRSGWFGFGSHVKYNSGNVYKAWHIRCVQIKSYIQLGNFDK